MNSLIENPASLELGGEKRRVTIMMTDLRGFTAMSERLAPEQVVSLLNGYFEVMVEVITRYQGTINEIVGDALLVFFGAPQDVPDRAQRAVACAIEMQNAMERVYARNRGAGLPDLEMGIGLNDAEVVVGNIGTASRSKYAAVGSGVNMTSRIESYTVGGEILISESVRQAAGAALRIDGQRDVLPKGAESPLRIYRGGYRPAVQPGARRARSDARPARGAGARTLRAGRFRGERADGRGGTHRPPGQPLRGAACRPAARGDGGPQDESRRRRRQPRDARLLRKGDRGFGGGHRPRAAHLDPTGGRRVLRGASPLRGGGAGLIGAG
jgi:class 3 adenylate cyclase